MPVRKPYPTITPTRRDTPTNRSDPATSTPRLSPPIDRRTLLLAATASLVGTLPRSGFAEGNRSENTSQRPAKPAPPSREDQEQENKRLERKAAASTDRPPTSPDDADRMEAVTRKARDNAAGAGPPPLSEHRSRTGALPAADTKPEWGGTPPRAIDRAIAPHSNQAGPGDLPGERQQEQNVKESQEQSAKRHFEK